MGIWPALSIFEHKGDIWFGADALTDALVCASHVQAKPLLPR